jgi:hypothetical protein
MQYKYTAQYTDYGLEHMPRITAIVKNPKTGIELPLFWLVDSGATETLLPRRIGERLGIEIESGERVEFEGVGGAAIGYRHKVVLRLAGERNEHEIECAFTPSLGMEALLGERGFFENYKVTFEKYKNVFSVTEKKT